MPNDLIRTAAAALLLAMPAAFAQSSNVSSHSFEVISIHENNTGGPRRFESTPTGFRATNLLLAVAIMTAYPPAASTAFGPKNIVGIPEWARSLHYDVTATIPETDLADWHNPQRQPELLRSMLQSMLHDRFRLTLHRETREDSVYSLVVAHSGPKLKPTDPAQPHPGRRLPFSDGGIMAPEALNGTIQYYDTPMSTLAFMLSDLTPHPVHDDTGLTGRYDFVIQHPANLNASTPQPDSPTASDPGPTVFSATAELGLKLIPTRRSVENLVIDHIEKPTEN